jgi:bifunctional non-homologous end joining protein LigD
MDRLRAAEVDRPPIDDPELAKVKGAKWVRPEIVCDVEYLQMTAIGKLRAPVFKGLRPDKLPEDCVLEVPTAGAPPADAEPTTAPARARRTTRTPP